MSGVDVGGGGKGGRKTLDSEVNMIPMIDLLMVTISFLLLTAVWTHMARLEADAQVPGEPRPDQPTENVPPEKQLHIDMKATDKFVLTWKQGATTVSGPIDVPRHDQISTVGNAEVVRFPDLAEKITSECKLQCQHVNATDTKWDQAIVHSDNQTEYRYIIGVMDAIYAPQRDVGGDKKLPSFNVTFSIN